MNRLRAETWGQALGVSNFPDFSFATSPAQTGQKIASSLPSALLYCNS
jgi:hypothetical protein